MMLWRKAIGAACIVVGVALFAYHLFAFKTGGADAAFSIWYLDINRIGIAGGAGIAVLGVVLWRW